MPRAEPCTIFGGCSHVSDAQLIYHKGHIRARTDLQPEGLSAEELSWVKINASTWGAPDCPLDLPDPADYDAASAPEEIPSDLPAATPETATCPACLQTRVGKKKCTRDHTLRWGECTKAPPPRPTGVNEEEVGGLQPIFESIDPEVRPREEDAGE